jgi:GDP-4-dehydro-6-deoxy-D-mannose reductase
MKKTLITGATGFAGAHLIRHLLKKNEHVIFGTYLEDSSLDRFGELNNKIQLEKIDLQETEKVAKLIEKIKPDIVYHLAAFTSTSLSFGSPAEVITNNVSSQANILEALRKLGLKTKILIVSSGDIYGKVRKEDLPIDEETPLNPTNPYSVSKITQDFLALQYFLAYGLNIVRVRPFNHIGPGQSPNFAIPAFSKKIAEIEKGKIKPILKVGNLESRKDFTSVLDVVKAYDLILDKGVPGEVYNIGSGKSYKIGDVLNKLLSFSKLPITVETDKSLLRPVDDAEFICDYSKLNKATGWKPEVSIDEMLLKTLDYWRNII